MAALGFAVNNAGRLAFRAASCCSIELQALAGKRLPCAGLGRLFGETPRSNDLQGNAGVLLHLIGRSPCLGSLRRQWPSGEMEIACAQLTPPTPYALPKLADVYA